ncbi:MAG: serine/threonine-protein kinase [Candidatus Micrarchaeota archaeon]
MSSPTERKRFEHARKLASKLRSFIFKPEPELSIARFSGMEEVARGCMGTVYHATDSETGREVAIKTANDSADARSALKNEAKMLGGLHHPNIVEFLGSGRIPGRGETPFIVMEFLHGSKLEMQAMRWELLKPALMSLCDALAAVHDAGIVHRDVKPDNIILTDKGVKLIDFGVAKRTGAIRSMAGLTFNPGNLGYAAPEMFGLSPDRRSDIYSVGAIMYRALTGKLPEDMARFYGNAVLEPALHGGFSEVVGKALELSPEKRFQSAREMRERIEALAMLES